MTTVLPLSSQRTSRSNNSTTTEFTKDRVEPQFHYRTTVPLHHHSSTTQPQFHYRTLWVLNRGDLDFCSRSTPPPPPPPPPAHSQTVPTHNLDTTSTPQQGCFGLSKQGTMITLCLCMGGHSDVYKPPSLLVLLLLQ